MSEEYIAHTPAIASLTGAIVERTMVVVAFDDTTLDDCPSEDAIASLHRATPAEITGIETHAAGCTTCMARLTLARGKTEVSGSAPAEAAAGLPRGTVVGRYVIERSIGEGGMGVVYAAFDKELDRRVAIKLLAQRPGSSSEWQVRMMREARAMARLSHPNIVPIFDIGTHGQQIFIAMELIEGVTLRAWRKLDHAWPEALEMFRQIGRGLAAVHDAGFVHRDVKPANILVGTDGRPRLTDFGVVKAGDERPSSDVIPLERVLANDLTRAGSVIGTIPYMAPEQLRGQVADPRTDQFSFCAMLYEALYGANPCTGRDPMHLDEWRIPDAPHGTDVPAWVRRVVVRGLHPDAAYRYPTMDALLAELEPPAAKKPITLRRALPIAAPAMGAAIIATVLLARHGTADNCPDPRVELEGVWDPARRAAMHDAFAGTGKPYAEASFTSVARYLDTFAEKWEAMRLEGCAVDNPVASECLQWRFERLRAVTDALMDGKALERAVGLASDLPSTLEECTHKSGPALDRSLKPQVDELRKKLEGAKYDASSKYANGIATAKSVVEGAQAIGYRPLEAEAYFALGDLQRRAGAFDASAESLDKAIVAAVAGRHPEIEAKAGIVLANLVGVEKAHYEDGHSRIEHARAAIERLGGDALLEAKLAHSLSILLRKEGKRTESLAQSARALELGQPVLGDNHPEVATWINSAGLTYLELGQFDEARTRFERARAIWARELGDTHPNVGLALGNLGLERFRTHRYDEAIALGLKGLAILEPAFGADSPRLVATLTMTGDAYTFSGRPATAIPMLERALRLQRKARSGPHPGLANNLTSLGIAYTESGDAAKARPLLEEALDIRTKLPGDPQDLAETQLGLAKALWKLDERDGAEALATKAREAFAACGARCKDDLDDVDAWRAAR